MKGEILLPTHNVFTDLGFSPEEAANLKMRAWLMSAVEYLIAHRRLTQVQAARLMNVSQPRISNLVRGHIERFSIDGLLAMLSAAGAAVEVAVFTDGVSLMQAPTRAASRPTRPRPRPAARPRARTRGRSAA